ncbi:unnamed protein product [Adineta ricciae]|uniref:Uncharacterized protein n=1 Tax=Adineta ricciae TaxID=249248 RepID=A0A814AH53_ADIRI|nr:unnamed protein product [Adineta ricciae]CAF0911784.1 unnamed protein product [Adineta ricciae]
MQTDYNFLSDHSYSIRVDYDKLPLKQREVKSKKRRATPISSKKASSAPYSVSIHRSSSDKENSSSNLNEVSVKSKANKMKLSTTSKKNSTKSRTASVKKQSVKSTPKSHAKSIPSKLVQKKTSIPSSKETSVMQPSLSIEERVKLRRTTPFLAPIKPITNKKPLKRIHLSKTKKETIKPKKFFLGSGLDLDNIVAGNRQRRSIQS